VLPLPGWRVQLPLQPELSYSRHFAPPPPSARQAAVMVLLYPDKDQLVVPLTLRTPGMIEHANQISLPGGSLDLGERSEAAARRELGEELGVIPEDLCILGELSALYLYNSNFAIQPWLATTGARPPWIPNTGEVAELIEAPLETLCDAGSRNAWEAERDSIRFEARGYEVAGHRVWGATAMILAEVVALVEEYRLQQF
jgi:8-oxo-dGTP pyrophosphatase MutT (NUDIX family)